MLKQIICGNPTINFYNNTRNAFIYEMKKRIKKMKERELGFQQTQFLLHTVDGSRGISTVPKP